MIEKIYLTILTLYISSTSSAPENDCSNPRLRSCKNRHCIAIEFFCDGNNDCGDWSDEINCSGIQVNSNLGNCPNGFLPCEMRHQSCIPLNKVCDGTNDCLDGFDEFNCSPTIYPKCPQNYFSCGGQSCISEEFVCDGEIDCKNSRDEVNCTAKVVDPSIKCPQDMFRCDSKISECLTWEHVCDTEIDCIGGKDEQCSSNNECKNGFKCGNECIIRQWVCDGIQDCSDGSDEEKCYFSHPDHTCWPRYGWFRCLSKGITRCLPIHKVCDGIVDCDDTSDEGGLCAIDCDSINMTCSNQCFRTPTGPFCSFKNGMVVEQKKIKMGSSNNSLQGTGSNAVHINKRLLPLCMLAIVWCNILLVHYFFPCKLTLEL